MSKYGHIRKMKPFLVEKHFTIDEKTEYCIDWTQDYNFSVTSSIKNPVTKIRLFVHFKMVIEQLFPICDPDCADRLNVCKSTFMIAAYA